MVAKCEEDSENKEGLVDQPLCVDYLEPCDRKKREAPTTKPTEKPKPTTIKIKIEKPKFTTKNPKSRILEPQGPQGKK